jgi:hypothetical protein
MSKQSFSIANELLSESVYIGGITPTWGTLTLVPEGNPGPPAADMLDPGSSD